MLPMSIQFVRKSSNAKTGAIPVTVSSRKTCPKACVFNHGNGCYADAGYYTRLNWDKVTNGERGTDYDTFINNIRKLPLGQLWRHNVAGDLVGANDVIDVEALAALTTANTGKRGFTYTHYPLQTGNNAAAIKAANKAGFTVNVSANSASEAVSAYKRYKLPTVAVLPIDAPEQQTIDGVKIVTCPATYRDDVTCASCKLCSVADRKVIVGFPAHGTQAKRANIIASA